MPDNARLLLVDSDDHRREATKRTLRLQGYVVSEAGTGWRAVEIAGSVEPDIVLADSHLSDMSGIDAAHTIVGVTQDPDLPVVFMADPEDVIAIVGIVDLRTVDYVKRPFDVPELSMRLRTNLRIRRLHSILRSREIAYRLLRNRASDIVMILDADLAIAYVNRAAQTFMGESATTLRRRTLADLVGPGTATAIVQRARACLRSRNWESAEFQSSATVRGGTGAPREIRFSVYPLGDPDSPGTRFMIIGQVGEIVPGPVARHVA